MSVCKSLVHGTFLPVLPPASKGPMHPGRWTPTSSQLARSSPRAFAPQRSRPCLWTVLLAPWQAPGLPGHHPRGRAWAVPDAAVTGPGSAPTAGPRGGFQGNAQRRAPPAAPGFPYLVGGRLTPGAAWPEALPFRRRQRAHAPRARSVPRSPRSVLAAMLSAPQIPDSPTAGGMATPARARLLTELWRPRGCAAPAPASAARGPSS